MKKSVILGMFILAFAISFTSCREKKTEAEATIEEMQEEGATMKKKVDGDEVKIKQEDGETKIKEETDDNS